MRVKKYNEGNKVVFVWEESIQLGVVESVILSKKSRKYELRAESGQLYPIMGVDTKTDFPGFIMSDITSKYYGKQKETIVVLEEEND
tara:strand:- start:87 stop:347 length:261 start_codon:yes stop_codon:yes gene_type:complete